jgi:rhamnogalacturonan endolyase
MKKTRTNGRPIAGSKSLIAYFCLISAALIFTRAALAFDDSPGGGIDDPQVTLLDNGTSVKLSNGILTATITKGNAALSSLRFKNFEMLESGYYNFGGHVDTGTYRQPSDCIYTVKVNTPDLVDIGFKSIWNKQAEAIDMEVHYVLKRGMTGLYSYAILDHPATYPAVGFGMWRMVWKLSDDLLEKIYVDDLRHWEMPNSQDYLHVQPTEIKEITKFTTGVMAGKYDGKYSYSASYYDIGCWGHASDKHKVGAWMVLGGYDFLNDGPMQQDLNAAAGINHIQFGMGHYNGSSEQIAAGQEWQKIYGPFLLYCDSSEQGADAMWADARRQVAIEKAEWPYQWLTDTPAYPPASQRGTVRGTFVVKDSLKPALNGANAWIGVAQPPPGGNWQFESNHYQYWVKTDTNGNFAIPNIRPGTYTLSAFTVGAVGEFTRENVPVAAGQTTALGTLTWSVPHKGRKIAWEIGVPDRTAREFRHGNDYFAGYVWQDLSKEFPNPLDYTIGKSTWTDWNYVQSWYMDGDKMVPWRWRIHFQLAAAPTAPATMTIAIASANNHARIDIYVNDETQPLGRISPSVQGGNAMLREGIHAKYCVEYLTIPAERLHAGENIISIEQRHLNTEAHIMYDYLNLEL